METLSSPFPWFGGKSRAASLIWDVLGNVGNYV
jgi:DNA adenine methylase